MNKFRKSHNGFGRNITRLRTGAESVGTPEADTGSICYRGNGEMM